MREFSTGREAGTGRGARLSLQRTVGSREPRALLRDPWEGPFASLGLGELGRAGGLWFVGRD